MKLAIIAIIVAAFGAAVYYVAPIFSALKFVG